MQIKINLWLLRFPIFLQKCLDKEPSKRWTCEELLTHPYFDNFQFQLPEQELEDFEKLRKHRDRSRVSC